MEAIGLLSSLLTLVSATIEGAKILKTIYKAPKELVSLLSELEHFDSIVREVQNLHQFNVLGPGVIGITLKRSKGVIEDLQELINAKLIDGHHGLSKKVRRMAWAKNKSRVLELKDSLRDSRHGLIAALSAVSSSFSIRTDGRLQSFDQSISQVQATTTSIRDTIQEQAFDTRRMIEENNRMIEEYNRTTQQVLNEFRLGVSYGNHLHQLSTRFQQSLQLISSGQNKTICTTQEEEEIFYDANTDNSSVPDVLLRLNSSITQEPATSFELSSNFYPEQYTQQLRRGLTTRLKVISMTEYSSTKSTRTDLYNIRFATSPRIWQVFTILLSISKESKYFGVTQIVKRHLSTSTSNNVNTLPAPFEDQFENLLLDTSPSEAHTNLSLEVVDSESGPKLEERPAYIRKEDEALRKKATALLDFLRDLGCPQFCESEVIQLGSYRHHSILCNLPDGTLCYETPVDLNDFNLWDRLTALNLLREKPHLYRFLGVVTSDRKTYVRGVLMQANKGYILERFMEADRQGTEVPWSRREKWARQVIGAVSSVHSTGNTVGNLGNFAGLDWSLDANGNAILLGYARRRDLWLNEKGVLPPECRPPNLNSIGLEKNTRADLFQLGMLLWYLAEPSIAISTGNPFCRKANCPRADQSCHEFHSNPIALPPLNIEIPHYYQEIINICRSENPSERWPASELLSKFPSSMEKTETVAHAPTMNIDSVELSTLKSPVHMWCDLCGYLSVKMEHYHCIICLNGYFDICRTCVEKGFHCQNYEHFLEERVLENSEIIRKKRYHSKMMSSGEMRETVFQF